MKRLILFSVLFFISLLAVFNAPTYHLWLLSIIVTEYCWIFIILTSICLVIAGLRPCKYRVHATVIGVISLVLFCSPIVRAYKVADDLPNELNKVFGASDNSSHPFTIASMFSGNPNEIKYSTRTYTINPDTGLTLDFYPAQANGNKPCVVVIHGGSWSSGDSQQLPELNNYLAKVGYNVASINYRMAPKYKCPAPLNDVRAALAYLRAHAIELKIDTANFVLLGRSAGAQIAMLAAYTMHDKAIKGVIDFYGPADMVWGYSLPASPLVMDSRGVMERYLGGTYKDVPQNYAASSPIEYVDRQSPPTLIIHGANDVLVAYEHSNRLSKKLTENNIKHYWLQLPWATHGFDYNLNGPGGQLSTYAVERFLKAVTYKPE
jgi:acetyl esterase/lipase